MPLSSRSLTLAPANRAPVSLPATRRPRCDPPRCALPFTRPEQSSPRPGPGCCEIPALDRQHGSTTSASHRRRPVFVCEAEPAAGAIDMLFTQVLLDLVVSSTLDSPNDGATKPSCRRGEPQKLLVRRGARRAVRIKGDGVLRPRLECSPVTVTCDSSSSIVRWKSSPAPLSRKGKCRSRLPVSTVEFAFHDRSRHSCSGRAADQPHLRTGAAAIRTATEDDVGPLKSALFGDSP